MGKKATVSNSKQPDNKSAQTKRILVGLGYKVEETENRLDNAHIFPRESWLVDFKGNRADGWLLKPDKEMSDDYWSMWFHRLYHPHFDCCESLIAEIERTGMYSIGYRRDELTHQVTTTIYMKGNDDQFVCMDDSICHNAEMTVSVICAIERFVTNHPNWRAPDVNKIYYPD